MSHADHMADEHKDMEGDGMRTGTGLKMHMHLELLVLQFFLFCFVYLCLFIIFRSESWCCHFDSLLFDSYRCNTIDS